MFLWHALRLIFLALRCGMAKVIASRLHTNRFFSILLHGFDKAFSFRRADVLEHLPQRLYRLGPGFVKCGQLLAMREDLIGADMAKRLTSLHYNVPPIAASTMHARLTKIAKTSRLTFNADPIAAGSVALVYFARLDTGEPCAVKLLRPDIKKDLNKDLHLIRSVYRFCKWLFPRYQMIRLEKMLEQLARSIDEECDLRVEAFHMTRFAKITKTQSDIIAPTVYWQHTQHDMLVMSYHEGDHITDKQSLTNAKHDPDHLIRRLTKLYFQHLFIDGWFHGDPHSGNIIVDDKGKLIFLDFGLIGQLDAANRRFLLSVMIAIRYRQTELLIDLHQKAGFIPKTTNIIALTAAINRMFQDNEAKNFLTRIKAIIDITSQFGISFAPSWPILHKTLLMLDGIIQDLGSDYSPRKTIADWFTNYIIEEIGQIGDLGDASLPLLSVLIELDHVTDQILLEMWQNHQFVKNIVA